MMEVKDAQLADTDTYTCIIHLAGNETENHTHTVVVYTIADYHMSYPFIYYVTECDYQLNNFKLHELHEFVCRDYEKNCPFHAVSTCHRYHSTISQVERSQLIVFIQQYPLEVYRPPSCDVLCIKKSIVQHFDLMGSYIIRELYNMEQNSQRKIYGNIIFSRDTSARLADVKARCQSGYELYQDIICMPCYPGHSLKYTYTAEEELSATKPSTVERCEPCQAHQFQDSFGMEECFYCPKETYTSSNGSISQDLCKKKGLPISWTLMILCGLLAAFLLAICCTWLVMACVAGTQKLRGSKKQEEAVRVATQSAYPPLNDQQPWIELLRQCEESGKTSPAGSPTTRPSPVPGIAEAPLGTGSSLRSVLKPQRPSVAETPIDSAPADLFRRSTDAYPPPPPLSSPVQYNQPIQAVPETSYPRGPAPTPLPPLPVAVAVPRLLERTSLVSVRSSLRPAVRQPVALVAKQSDTNIYRQALMSGLREVRIVPPGGSGTAARLSMNKSGENWSQHSGAFPPQGPMGSSSASSNSKQTATAQVHQAAQATPVESAQSLYGGDPYAGFPSFDQRNSLLSVAEQLGQTALPVEIEVEFQRVIPPGTTRPRPLPSPPHPGSRIQPPANATPRGSGQRQRSSQTPRNISSGTESRIAGSESLPMRQSTASSVWPQRIDNQPQQFGLASSVPYQYSLSQQEIDAMVGGQSRVLEPYHVRLQSSGSTQESETELQQRTGPPSVDGRRGRHGAVAAATDSQSTQVSQGSSETTNPRPSVGQSSSSAETGRYTVGSRRSSEVDQSVISRQSTSESTEHHRSHHQSRSGPEAAASQGPHHHQQQQRLMGKSLLDAINARSTPTHEDTNVYE